MHNIKYHVVKVVTCWLIIKWRYKAFKGSGASQIAQGTEDKTKNPIKKVALRDTNKLILWVSNIIFII